LSPDYIMHLILLGPVRLKYIALTLLFLDIIGTRGMINSGGHFAHLGGAFWGMFYVYLLRNGTDLTEPFQEGTKKIKSSREKTSKDRFSVVHKKANQVTDPTTQLKNGTQEELDRILDKINKLGYDELSAEEKEFLYQASKKK